MSRYQEIRFRGVVKQEFREEFDLIAIGGRWKESSDKILRAFGNVFWEAQNIPIAARDCSRNVKRWNETPWERSWDKETGVWQFQIAMNVNSFNFWYHFEEEILPYLMESVEHYEVWQEPLENKPHDETTLFMQLTDGKWGEIGFFGEDGTYQPKDREK